LNKSVSRVNISSGHKVRVAVHCKRGDRPNQLMLHAGTKSFVTEAESSRSSNVCQSFSTQRAAIAARGPMLMPPHDHRRCCRQYHCRWGSQFFDFGSGHHIGVGNLTVINRGCPVGYYLARTATVRCAGGGLSLLDRFTDASVGNF